MKLRVLDAAEREVTDSFDYYSDAGNRRISRICMGGEGSFEGENILGIRAAQSGID